MMTIQDYTVQIEMAVRWGDMDAFQHVNNTLYFRYFETARVAYFDRLGGMEIERMGGIGPILAWTDCRFRLPITHPDALTVGTRVVEMGLDRFLIEHGVHSTQHGRLAAQGHALVVMYDYRKLEKAAIPETLRAGIIELEGRELPPLSRKG